jgi:hypothetical protein
MPEVVAIDEPARSKGNESIPFVVRGEDEFQDSGALFYAKDTTHSFKKELIAC